MGRGVYLTNTGSGAESERWSFAFLFVVVAMIQTHKRLKGMLFIKTKYSM